MEIIEQLYREHAGACYGVACGMLGDSHAAQDVVQEAFCGCGNSGGGWI